MPSDIYRAVVSALDRGEAAALVTVVSASGSTPQRVGAKMLVFGDGRTEGTIGGGSVEHDAIRQASDSIQQRRARLVHYALNSDPAAGTDPICGGQMDVYIEPVEPAAHLYLVGAGHVALELARIGRQMGFRLHVLDDRQEFANQNRFPDADVVVDEIAGWLARAPIPSSAFVVVVTRGHANDLEAMKVLVRRDLRYLGLIGSRAKVTQIFEALRSDGVPHARLDRVFAPIGLDIGAVSPAEIAVSIAAELIAVRSGRIEAPEVASACLSRCGRT